MKFKWLFIIIFFVITVCTITNAQNEDNVWLFGGNPENIEVNGYQYGNTVLDFSDIEPSVYYDSLVTMDFAGANSSICDSDGNLSLYTNGMEIYGNDHNPIIYGDTIAYSDFWELWSIDNYFENGDDWIGGFPIVQGIVILPLDESGNNYIALYQVRAKDEGPSYVKSLNYSLISRNSNGKFEVTLKDVVIVEDEFNPGQIHPCRHANGRDWWLIQQNVEGDTVSVFMITKKGVSLHNQFNKDAWPVPLSVSQVAYSADGELYAIANSQYLNEVGGDLSIVLNVFSFDRCEGQLVELGSDIMLNRGIRGVTAFSPSGQYLYISNHEEIFQYDMHEEDWVASRELIATYDGFFFQYNEYSSEARTRFGSMALGPDGRIYSVPSGSNRFLNVIEYPDEKGIDAEVRQHKIMIPTSNFNSTPNLPDYRMGPVEGSLCDTLGIESLLKAQFRFEEDSTNYLNIRFTDISYNDIDSWLWEFGDGNIYEDQKPYYYEYSEAGAYNVCLTVRRGTKEDKFCRTLYLGVTANENILLTENQVSLYPNPVSDFITVEIKDYVPNNVHIIIYNNWGKTIVKQKMKAHNNQIDLRAYNQGMYHLTLVNSEGVLFSDTFIKI